MLNQPDLTKTSPAPAEELNTAVGQLASFLTPPAGFSVLGLGVDLAEIKEFERLNFEKYPAFYRRCFSAAEVAYCLKQPAPAQHFAARFAAKEAAIKAFSSYFMLMQWQVEVIKQENGAPGLLIWDFNREQLLIEAASYRTLVSLSHSGEYALAAVAIGR